MNFSKLSPRLLAAAELVRGGAFLADVGSDHAYLPIYLCLAGKLRGAVASDINEGPVARAKINIAASHLGNKISVVCTDGLSGIEEYSPDNIVICGMGGELICEIIKKAPWTKDKKIRLILQPMTHADKLRDFLNVNGYTVKAERLVKEDKIYQIICAEYSGVSEQYSDIELIFGKQNIYERSEVFLEYAGYVKNVFLTRQSGKRCAGADTSEEDYILGEIEKILNGKGGT